LFAPQWMKATSYSLHLPVTALRLAFHSSTNLNLVIRLVLQNPNLSAAMQSISCRVTLSILLALPQMSPASLSCDPKLHPLLLERVQELSIELGAGSTGGMSKNLGLVIGVSLADSHVSICVLSMFSPLIICVSVTEILRCLYIRDFLH
jgi:hypothetical protein